MKKNKITIKTQTGVLKFTTEQFSRWICLFEACDFITEHAAKLNMSSDDMLKPAAIEEYIGIRYPSVFADVKYEVDHGILT
jgi:hypothetical protein